MKKLMLVTILGFVLIASYAMAQDVTITITIPDAQVARVAAAITGGIDCGALNPQNCLKRELIRHLRRLVLSYEASQIITGANAEIDALTEPEAN